MAEAHLDPITRFRAAGFVNYGSRKTACNTGENRACSRVSLVHLLYKQSTRQEIALISSYRTFADVNWGCGSSRENAVSVLRANKVRSVLAPSFGDIHYNNCIKNGVLPLRLSSEACETLRRQLHESPGAEVAIDLDAQSLTGPDQTTYNFEIDAFDKHRLLNGLDEIGLTMKYEADIADFKSRYEAKHPWAS